MRTTINHALDVLVNDEQHPLPANREELIRIVRRVQQDYLEIIETALSLLIQNKRDECLTYLGEERAKLIPVKERIGGLITAEDRWTLPLHRLAIEYLFTRARLVDEVRLFPDFALELLDRHSLDQSIADTITYLEEAMTGKGNLYNSLIQLK